MGKLLRTLQERAQCQQVNHAEQLAEATLANDMLRAQLGTSCDEHAEMRRRMHDTQVQLRSERQKHQTQRQHMESRCQDAERKVELLERKLASMEKKAKRAKGFASQFFDEKMEIQKQLQGYARACCVCFAETADLMVLFPCGHACLCVPCGRTIMRCPLCAVDIAQRTRLYIS